MDKGLLILASPEAKGGRSVMGGSSKPESQASDYSSEKEDLGMSLDVPTEKLPDGTKEGDYVALKGKVSKLDDKGATIEIFEANLTPDEGEEEKSEEDIRSMAEEADAGNA
jgi:hypothetical protein